MAVLLEKQVVEIIKKNLHQNMKNETTISIPKKIMNELDRTTHSHHHHMNSFYPDTICFLQEYYQLNLINY